jgi:hypothetical protein
MVSGRDHMLYLFRKLMAKKQALGPPAGDDNDEYIPF